MLLVKETLYREIARYIEENWEKIKLDYNTYSELTKHLNQKFGCNSNSATISTIMYALAGARDVRIS